MYSSGPPDKVLSPAERIEAERQRNNSIIAVDRARQRASQIRGLSRKLTPEEKRERRLAQYKRDDERRRRNLEYDEALARAKKKVRQRTRGMIGPRRGTYDEITTVTARYELLNLDPDSRAYGSGYFWEGKPGEKGYFAPPLPTKISTVPITELTVEQVKRGMAEQGPDLPGCGFVRHGEGEWPGEGRPGMDPRDLNMVDKWDSWTQAGATEDFRREQGRKLQDRG